MSEYIWYRDIYASFSFPHVCIHSFGWLCRSSVLASSSVLQFLSNWLPFFFASRQKSWPYDHSVSCCKCTENAILAQLLVDSSQFTGRFHNMDDRNHEMLSQKELFRCDNQNWNSHTGQRNHKNNNIKLEKKNEQNVWLEMEK